MTRPEILSGNDAIRCDACPVACHIKPGRTGACDRYGNLEGHLVRMAPHIVLQRRVASGEEVVRLGDGSEPWDGTVLRGPEHFVTAIGAGTTYPDYKPAPFIVSSKADGVDMVTVVTEGIFSYCGVKVKIDTDRHIGAERSLVRASGEAVGHVTTSEYGSQMLSLGGVHHLTGGSRQQGTATCEAIMNLANGKSVELTVDGGATLRIAAGKPAEINGRMEERMRVGCGSATIGIFAGQWAGKVDEVVVVDDHITGVMSEHQAGRMLDVPPTGIQIRGRRSTAGRYFQVAEPGMGWGGTDVSDPLAIVRGFNPKIAWPGLRLLMVSTTGEQYAYFELDEQLYPIAKELPDALRQSVERVRDNCEPARTSVLFLCGAGGSLRAGVTGNPVRLTESIHQGKTRVTSGGAPVYLWPGGGITLMVDVTQLPRDAFGYVPTPAIVAPIEFTLSLAAYRAMGGHMDCVRSLESVVQGERTKLLGAGVGSAWSMEDAIYKEQFA